MKDYTVLLLYPEYLADEYGEETYLAHVSVNDTTEAIYAARLEAAFEFTTTDEDDEFTNPDDFFVLLVCEGHIEDLKP